MKEQLINDTCMLFATAFPDIDLERVRSIITLSMDGYDVKRTCKDVTTYEGDTNERVIKNFLVAKRVNGASDLTIKSYAFQLDKFFKKVGKRVDEVTANDIRIYFAKRELEDGVSSVTRNNELRIMDSLFQWLTDEEYIRHNPVRKISKIKVKKTKKKAFDSLEIELIRNQCKNAKETAIIEILISTGCRVSELCGIRVDEIDDDTIVIHGKGNKDRMCYLTAKAQVAIKKYMQCDYYKKRHALGSPYLFMGKGIEDKAYMRPMATGSVEGTTKNIGRQAGVTNCHPHRFRRTCATMALDRGMPIEQVSKMLGHESLETTQIYLDLSEESLKNAHKKYVV